MIQSYTFSIINVLLGSSRSESPLADLDILDISPESNSLIVKSNKIITISNHVLDKTDINKYQLKVANKDQFNELLRILHSEVKPITYSLENNYTATGQYLKFVSSNIQIELMINVLKNTLESNPISWQ